MRSGGLQSPLERHSERSEESPGCGASPYAPTRFFAALRMTVPTVWSKIATLQSCCSTGKMPVLQIGPPRRSSANAGDFDPQQRRQLLDFVGDMADSDGGVMGGARLTPGIHEHPGPNRKAIAAVGVADL